MKKSTKFIISVIILGALFALQFILSGCDISSGTVKRTSDDNTLVYYYNENKYIEDKSGIFKENYHYTKEMIVLGWSCDLPFAMMREYKSDSKENPEFIIQDSFPICLNENIDFLQRVMIYQDSNGETALSFTFENVLKEKVEEDITRGSESIGSMFFIMEDNPMIASYCTMVSCNGEYYLLFENINTALYKLSPDFVDAFKKIATK